ncbi:uncharacterized protein LOC122363716 isoform X2 [Amphibalanus amphitrite]|nr:uncharacterized protein LOC122363716 isoform X2 [Amphibalanus amphitrite]XP_043189201.1 uncharacterized protein LOC122363716 isoform X2 [Amphibalanus amphitrite]XP_043189202.1 uncharacterized protein LOC122363716 isoform X2 [Amphibalanus amphitrite]
MALLCRRWLGQVALGARSMHAHRLSDNMALLTASQVSPRHEPQLLGIGERPLAVMLPWLRATKKGISKYANFYLSQGFNVLVGTISARQLLLPETGSQETARRLVDFLLTHEEVNQYVVHSFSIGAYYWGEILGQLCQMDPEKTITRKITGVVFDSPADMEEIPVGLPMALTDFVPLQRLIASYARLHLRWMEQRATRHYREAKRQVVHYPMPQAATLFLWSQNDPVTSCRAILDLGAAFEASGRQVFYKCWADSQHVRHLLQHPGDYHSEVAEFLRRLGHLRYPDRFPDHQPAARAAIRQ